MHTPPGGSRVPKQDVGRRRRRSARSKMRGGETIVEPCRFAVNRTHHVDAELRYDTADPLLVTLAFSKQQARRQRRKNLEWFFLREMLSVAMLEPVGKGDVRMQSDGYAFTLELSSPSGDCELVCLTSIVQNFLDRTLNLVRQCTVNDLLATGPVRLCEDSKCVEYNAVRNEIDLLHESGYL